MRDVGSSSLKQLRPLTEVLSGVVVKEQSANLPEAVTGIQYDSRKINAGEIFVAIKGQNHDGHAFIRKAREKDVAAVVVEEPVENPKEGPFIRVPDSRVALARMAANYYQHPSRSILMIGVTGTNGKTTVCYLIEAILKAAGHAVGVIGTINYRYEDTVWEGLHTTPESLDLQRILSEMVSASVSAVVMEVSSHALELHRVDACELDGGVFTNLSQDHLDFHQNMERYFAAKKRLFTEILSSGRNGGSSWGTFNVDDPWGRRLAEEFTGPSLRYGLSQPQCDVKAVEVEEGLKGVKVIIQTPSTSLPVYSSMVGGFNVSNILAGVGAATNLKIPAAVIQEGIQSMSLVPGRMERFVGEDGLTVIVDYAHTPDALEKVLNTLRELHRGRIITVFGCGGDRDAGKRPIMGKTVASLSHLSVVTSDNPRDEDPERIIEDILMGIDNISDRMCTEEGIIKGETDKGVLVISDRRKAIELAIRYARSRDMVLIAGKGHETYQIIGQKKLPFDERRMIPEMLQLRTAKRT